MARIARTTLLLAAAALSWAAPVFAADGAGWHTDFRKAVARATRLQRPLLLAFTGSDWCGWCRTLKEEVFDTPEFDAWARKTVVLVEVDFPRAVRQKPQLRKQNRWIARRFSESVQGYPTVLFLDPTGTRVLGELGYREGGPTLWTEEADKALRR